MHGLPVVWCSCRYHDLGLRSTLGLLHRCLHLGRHLGVLARRSGHARLRRDLILRRMRLRHRIALRRLHLHLGVLRGIAMLIAIWRLWRSIRCVLAVRIGLRRPVVSWIHGGRSQ